MGNRLPHKPRFFLAVFLPLSLIMGICAFAVESVEPTVIDTGGKVDSSTGFPIESSGGNALDGGKDGSALFEQPAPLPVCIEGSFKGKIELRGISGISIIPMTNEALGTRVEVVGASAHIVGDLLPPKTPPGATAAGDNSMTNTEPPPSEVQTSFDVVRDFPVIVAFLLPRGTNTDPFDFLRRRFAIQGVNFAQEAFSLKKVLDFIENDGIKSGFYLKDQGLSYSNRQAVYRLPDVPCVYEIKKGIELNDSGQLRAPGNQRIH